MDALALNSPFLPSSLPNPNGLNPFSIPKRKKPNHRPRKPTKITASVHSDAWSLSDGDPARSRTPVPDEYARRIVKGRARDLSQLRKHVGAPRWRRRAPEQMVRYLEDDRSGQVYGKHVLAAIRAVRAMSSARTGQERDVRVVMGGFVGKLTFREMCIVLREQKRWREARDFFSWMKLQAGIDSVFLMIELCFKQLSYRPSVPAYTLLLRLYGRLGKISMAEQTFLEMLEAGCEPDEVACGTMLCTYARWGHHKAMFSFYSAIKERRLALPVSVYNFILSSLQKKSRHEKVIELWREMVDERVDPDAFTYTVVISSFAKQGLYDEAFKTFNKMRSNGLVPEEVIYGTLISENTRNGEWNEALQLYEDMKFNRIIPSRFTCASLLTMYYKTEDYSKALSLFTLMRSKRIEIDEVIYGLLIRIYGKLGLYDDAQKTFEEVKRLDLLSKQKTYLTMAQIHLNSGNYENALDVIKLMKSKNIWLSRFGYIVLLQCYVLKEDLSSAEDTFLGLSRTGFPDAGSCSDMLNLYLRLGLTEKAKTFILMVMKNKVAFDKELFRKVVKVLCKEGMLKNLEELVETARENTLLTGCKFYQTFLKVVHGETGDLEKLLASHQFDILALGLIIRLYLADVNSAKIEDKLRILLKTEIGASLVNQLANKDIREGNLGKAETLYFQVTKLGLMLNDETSASLIKLYGEHRKLEKAEEVFSIVTEYPKRMKLARNAMIEAYGKFGKPEEAYALYKESTEREYRDSAVGISRAVTALTGCGKFQDAEIIITKSLNERMELDTIAYNTFIKAMLDAGRLQFAASIFEHMLSSGVTPSIQTYSIMISLHGRSRKLDKAVEIFNTARSAGSLDEKAYMSMITYYGKAGKTQEASLLFEQMQEAGIKPGHVSYNIMIGIYAAGGYYPEVENNFQAMQRNGCSPDEWTYLSVVQAYAKSSKFSEAEETIQSMWNKGIFPSSRHYNYLLTSFVEAGLMGEAERIHQQLLVSGLSSSTQCYRTMLRGYLDHGLVEEGIKFYEQIRDSANPETFVMSAAVHLYKSAGQESKAGDLLESMKSLRIPFLHKLKVGSRTSTS